MSDSTGSARAVSTVEGHTTFPPYRGFRFEEERALMAMLSGLTVPDHRGNPLRVNVTFRDPTRELSPASQGSAPPGPNRVTYPYFLLEFLDMTPRRNEEVRGYVPFFFEAYTANSAVDKHLHGFYPIPVMLHYQCSVFSQNQQHDVILNDLLATTFFPIRFGQITCPSGTVRRLDYESGPINRDSINSEHQIIYSKTWEIAISAEFVPTQTGTEQVTEVDVQVEIRPTNEVDLAFKVPE